SENCVAARRARRAYSFASKSIHAVLALHAPTEREGSAMNKNKNITVVLFLVLAAGCISRPQDGAYLPPMDPTRKVNEQDCTRPVVTDGRGNLMCREVTERERRAKLAEEERQAKAGRAAEEGRATAGGGAEEPAAREPPDRR